MSKDSQHRPWYRPMLRESDVDAYLTVGETRVLSERPSLRVWFWDEFPLFAVGLVMWQIVLLSGDANVARLAFVMSIGLLIYLVSSFVRRWCTRYVLTDHRAIRFSGVFEERVEWMSWKKVTDVSIHASFSERLLNAATVKVQSANEASGFKDMKGIHNPHAFAQTIAELVNEAHGPIILAPEFS